MPVTLIMMRCKKAAGMIEPGGDLPKGPAQHPATRPSSNQTEAGDPMDQGSRSSRSIISLFGPLLVIAASAAAASIAPKSRAASKIMSQPIGSDFPQHFDIAIPAGVLFDVCQKRGDGQIRIVSEHLFECFSGLSLWFIHRSLRYSWSSADIGWAGFFHA